ncbi:MAG: tetratricopeptide repeat protein [Vicinamibacterales bacterium]
MRSRSTLLALAMAAVLAASCAPVEPPAIAPTTPQHPEYVFPAAPAGTPQVTLDRLTRGWQRLQANDLGGAEKELQALVTAQPAFAPARAALGYVDLARKRGEAAVAHFDAASPAARPYAPALVGRGLAELDARRDEAALASFEAALAADRTIPDLAERVATLRVRVVQDRIGRAERAAAAGNLDEARAAYRAAIEASPDAAFLYRDLALVERRAGRPETALDLARAALVHDADDAKAHTLIGDVLAERSEFDEALAAYRRAAAIDPSPALDQAIARVRDRAREAALPVQYRTIGERPQATRADLAALLGVRLAAALARAPQRQVVVTDLRGHWAQAWMQAVARAGAMEVYANYTFQPGAAVRRADLADTVSRTLALVAPAASVAKWDAAPVTASDVPAAHLAFPAVRRAVASGLLPLEGGAFQLLRPVTGAEAAQVVDRLAAMAGGRR